MIRHLSQRVNYMYTDATHVHFLDSVDYNQYALAKEDLVECDPGVKGDSATSRTKPATLETGLVVQVPEYLSEGVTIKVDTRTGQYLSRA